MKKKFTLSFIVSFIIILMLFGYNLETKPITSNPNASKEAQCVLKYLYSLKGKTSGKIISGQMTNMGINSNDAYQNDIVGIYNKYGKWPGIIGSNHQRVPAGLPQNMHETNKPIIDYFRKGGLVTMFCSFSNPWTNKGFNDTTGRYQLMDLIDPSKPVYKEWMKRLDSAAAGLKELQDSGVVILYRFFPENNGNWFWWGSQTATTPTQEDWKKIWIHAHDYFTSVKKLNNILWVFAPSAKESNNKNPNFKPDMYYYPGNDYVDIVGTSVYSDSLDIPYYNEIKATGKLMALTEFGPGMQSRTGKDYDYTTLIRQIKQKYPDFLYWVSWNDFVTNGGKDTVSYSFLNHLNGYELLSDNWVINRDEIDWSSGCDISGTMESAPSNPNATERTRCIYKYICELPANAGHKIISGQMTNAFFTPYAGYMAMIENLHTKTGKWVGIIGTDYQRSWPPRITQTKEANQVLIDYFNKGGLVHVMWSASNPWTGGTQNDTRNNKQIGDLVKTGTTVNLVFNKMLDSVALGFRFLQDSGVSVLFRPFHEMNGSWFWWGSGSESTNGPEDYKNLWKYIYNYFTNTWKLNNILWVFSTSAKGTDVSNPSFRDELYFYPGDEYVDIIGVDIYNDTLDIPNYSKLKAKNKPLALSEFGPTKEKTLNGPGTYDYTKLLSQIKTKYPDIVYWMSWNDFSTGTGGKDTVYYGMPNQLKASELLNDSYVINRDDFDWADYCNTTLSVKTLLEPEDGRVYHGVQLMSFEQTSDPLEGYLGALNDSTIQPAVRGFFFSIPGERGPANTLKGLINFFHSADSVGFIPEVSLFFIDKRGSTDSIIAVSTEHDWILDSIITLSKSYGRKMFLRIGGEFNGKGEGWNGGGYHPYYYVTMFRKIVDKFAAKGLRDSIAVNWCYEPDAANDFDSVDSNGALWYPGDEYVDWFGIDVFDATHFDQSLPDTTGRNITKKGKSERFLAMARRKDKPVYMSETSVKGINISADNSDGINDWNNWFAKFWEFIDKHKEIKGFNYINANWPVDAYPGWGDSRIQNSAYITQKYKEEMKKPKYIHLNQGNQPNNGPWNSSLMIVTSTDGANFSQSKIFQDSAGVPCIIKWKGDTLACVFQWFRAPVNSPTWDRVAVKFSYDNGTSWTEPVPIVVNNIPANFQRPFDPTLTVYDKDKLRIYYSSSNGMPVGLDTSINTYSAVSTDGINFEFEPGARYDNSKTKVIDPAVIYFKNEWHYLSPAGAPQDGAYHCTSTDGLNFIQKANYSSDNIHNWTGNFTVENENELRFYGCGADIWYNNSTDGYSWGNYTKTNIKGGDPGVVKISANNYIMVYVGQPGNQLLPPPKITLVSPLNNSQSGTFPQIFVWKGYPDIDSYHLQVSFNNRFNQFVVNDSILKDTSFVFNKMIPDSGYYWRVRAKNSAGTGEWSDVWRFRYIKAADSLFTATPLTEMGKSMYKTYSGGLYPNTQNIRPEEHNSNGLALANSILPLNEMGEIDVANGKIVLLSVGMSNCTQEFQRFMGMADTFKLKNPKLVIVDGAQGGQTASIIKDPNASFWKIIDTARLPQKQVNNLQVQAVWLKEANHSPTQAFPVHANMLKEDLKAIVQLLVQKFPNLKLVYLSSRTYGGYATSQLNPEPYAFESGFSVKWLIEEQINGGEDLDYQGSKRLAPWLSWGPYLWGNGPNPRADGLVWLKEDFVTSDGTHPSDKGRIKVATMLLDFFRTDETSVPWFLAGKVGVDEEIKTGVEISIYPNPASDYIEIRKPSEGWQPSEGSKISIFNTLGECVMESIIHPMTASHRMNIEHLPVGIYFIKMGKYLDFFWVQR